ncbi:queuosine precursor transporter [Burkholderia sp. L27(2015)]|uniref:queuosine precursor transporter n=1 Tax=Burkholderia sp. L27(2015) TaxID=1641858 RepID=UPI00349EA9A8
MASFFILLAAIVSNLTSYKIVEFVGVQASIGTLTMPIILMLLNPVAEVYGREKSNQILIAICVLEVCFSVIFVALSHLQNDCTLLQGDADHRKCEAINLAHTIVSQNIIRGSISFSVGFIVGGYLNSVFLLYLKRLWSIKKFYVRNVSSSIVGEVIYTAICFTLAFYGVFPFLTIVKISAFSLVFKLFATLLLSWISKIAVQLFTEHKNWSESISSIRTVKFSSRHMQI